MRGLRVLELRGLTSRSAGETIVARVPSGVIGMPEVPPDPTGSIDDSDSFLTGCFWIALVITVLGVVIIVAWMDWVSGCGPGGCL